MLGGPSPQSDTSSPILVSWGPGLGPAFLLKLLMAGTRSAFPGPSDSGLVSTASSSACSQSVERWVSGTLLLQATSQVPQTEARRSWLSGRPLVISHFP